MGLSLSNEAASSAKRPPEPEEVFLSWLLSQPAGRDLAAAADVEIERLRQYSGSHEGPKRLGAIFAEFRATLSPRLCPRLQ